ncbi:MAG: TRAP transporter substrate-binding protein [Longicatena sp.]
MKRKMNIFFLVGCLSLVSGCTQKIEDPVAASKRYPWIIATDSPADTVTSIFANKFAEEVERLSDGEIQMEVYENGTLGGDRELIESCMGGDISFILQNTAPQVSFIPKLAIFDLPVAYTSIDKLRTTLDDTNFMNMINQVYEEHGFRLLGLGDQSFRVMTTNEKITDVNDFKGQKIRTMENKNHIAFWQSIGANPTPMTFSEVYIGLQQGTIDAQENPYEVVVSGKIYEQQDYIVQTNHLPHLLSLIVNNDFYDSLPDDAKAIVDEASENAKQYARQQADKRVSDRLKIITDSGTNIIEVDQTMIEQLRNKASGVYETIRKQAGEELYEAYTKHME